MSLTTLILETNTMATTTNTTGKPSKGPSVGGYVNDIIAIRGNTTQLKK